MNLFKLLRRQTARQLDPLQVSMTGVKMGERFLMIGCDDRGLLAGLASKTGLSGFAAAATFDEESAGRARAIGAKIGALIEVHSITDALPFDSHAFDMVVVDDTHGGFASQSSGVRVSCLREGRRVLRAGGRIDVVEGSGGGLFGGAVSRQAHYDVLQEMSAAGFAPVRLLAERDGFRFLEGISAVRRDT
jgi:SAM-dependent methyltransferase